MQYSINSSCSSLQFTGNCIFSTDGSSNVIITFSSIIFSIVSTNYMDVRIDNVVVSYTGTLTVGAIFSVSGSPSLSTTTPANIGQMYS